MTLQLKDVDQAVGLAYRAHRWQVDKAGRPYMDHVMRVESYVCTIDYLHRIVATLHDVVEDTPVTLEAIDILFGEEVRDAVDALTRRGTETYSHYIERVATNKVALKVKLADLTEHLTSTDSIEKSLIERYDRAFSILIKTM